MLQPEAARASAPPRPLPGAGAGTQAESARHASRFSVNYAFTNPHRDGDYASVPAAAYCVGFFTLGRPSFTLGSASDVPDAPVETPRRGRFCETSLPDNGMAFGQVSNSGL